MAKINIDIGADASGANNELKKLQDRLNEVYIKLDKVTEKLNLLSQTKKINVSGNFDSVTPVIQQINNQVQKSTQMKTELTDLKKELTEYANQLERVIGLQNKITNNPNSTGNYNQKNRVFHQNVNTPLELDTTALEVQSSLFKKNNKLLFKQTLSDDDAYLRRLQLMDNEQQKVLKQREEINRVNMVNDLGATVSQLYTDPRDITKAQRKILSAYVSGNNTRLDNLYNGYNSQLSQKWLQQAQNDFFAEAQKIQEKKDQTQTHKALQNHFEVVFGPAGNSVGSNADLFKREGEAVRKAEKEREQQQAKFNEKEREKDNKNQEVQAQKKKAKDGEHKSAKWKGEYNGDAFNDEYADWFRGVTEQKGDTYRGMQEAAIMNSIFKVTGGATGSRGDTGIDAFGFGVHDSLKNALSSINADSLLSSSGILLGSGFNAMTSFYTNKVRTSVFDDELRKSKAFNEYLDASGKNDGSLSKKEKNELFKEFKKNGKVRIEGEDGKSRTVDYKNRAYLEVMKNNDALTRIGKSGIIISGAVAAVTGIASAVKKLGDESIQAYEKIQSLQTQLSVVYSSDTAATSAFNQIEAYAKKSPFGVETMTQQAILLKQSGVYGSDLMDTMSRIGDLASGNAEKMKSISEVYARILSSTTVTARDMRQLANAGVPSYKALTESYKKASSAELSTRGLNSNIQQSQIRSMLQGGKVTSEDFKRMIESLTDKGGTFYNAVEKGAQTLMARKQNLSDAKEMARAAFGEWLTKFGGTNTNNSIYGRYLTFKENLYQNEEDAFTARNLKNEYKAAVIAIENASITVDGKKELRDYNLLASLGLESFIRDDYSEYVNDKLKSGSESYERFGMGAQGNEHTSPELEEFAALVSILENPGSAWIFGDEGKKISKQLNAQGYFGEDGEKLRKAELDKYKEDIDNYLVKTEHDISSVGLAFLPGRNTTMYKVKQYDNTENKLDWDITQFQNAGAAAADFADSLRTATSSVLNLKTKAITDFDNSSYGTMLRNDAQYFNNEEIKRRILNESKTLATGVNADGTLNIDMSRIAQNTIPGARAGDYVSSYLTAYGDLGTDASAILTNFGELFGRNGELTKTGTEEFTLFVENMRQLLSIFQKEGSSTFMGMDAYKAIVDEYNTAYQILNGQLDADSFDDMQKFSKQFEESLKKEVESGKMSQSLVDSILNAVKLTRLDTTFSDDGASKINDRAHLWQNILANATGISVDRVRELKGAGTMNLYSTNLSKRNEFSTVAKSLLDAGVSLGKISSNLIRTKIGYDGTQEFNWDKSSKNIEKLASERSVETQQTLINAYQQQIDTLNQLEVNGVATADEWSNLHDQSQILGSAFSLAAEQMEDGSYKFSEATINGAENMKKELNGKLFKEKLNLAFRSAAKNVFDTNKNTQIENLLLSGYVNIPGKRLSDKDLGQVANVYSELIKSNNTSGWNGATESIKNLDNSSKAFVNQIWKSIGNSYLGFFMPQLKNEISDTAIADLFNTFDTVGPDIQSLLIQFVDALNGGKQSIINYSKALETSADAQKENERILENRKIFENIANLAGMESKPDNPLNNPSRQSKYYSSWNPSQFKDMLGLLNLGDNNNLFTSIDYISSEMRKATNTSSLYESQKELENAADVIKNKYANPAITASVQSKLFGLDGEEEEVYDYTDIINQLEEYGYIFNDSVKTDLSAYDNNSLSKEAIIAMATNASINPKEQADAYLKAHDYIGDISEVRKSAYNNNKSIYDALGEYLIGNIDSITEELSAGGNLDEIKEKLGLTESQSLTDGLIGPDGVADAEKLVQIFDTMREVLGDVKMDSFLSGMNKSIVATEYMTQSWEKFKNETFDILVDSLSSSIFTTLPKQIGENAYNLSHNLATSEEAGEELSKALAGVGSELLSSVSSAAINAGLNIASAAAMEQNWGMVAAGLGLAAAGGFGNLASGYLDAYTSASDSSDDEADRLEKLKDNLADLLSQARNDAEYYETTLRSKSAIAANDELSQIYATSVNDMILTDKGVFSTDPKDTIMAMKDPASLIGSGGTSYSPNISFTVVNESGQTLSVSNTESTVSSSGDIDIVATIDSVVKKGFTSGTYDEAISLMQTRQKGTVVSA